MSKKILTSMVDGEARSPATATLTSFAKILRIFGRKNCKETIFALENKIFRRKNRPVPTVHAAGHDWKFDPLELSRGFRQIEGSPAAQAEGSPCRMLRNLYLIN